MKYKAEPNSSTVGAKLMPRGYKRYSDYKDSGVEWLGEIPESWSRKKLASVAVQKHNSFVDGPFGSDLKSNEYKTSGIPLIQLNNVKEGIHLVHKLKFISEDKKVELSRHIAKQGDVVIAKMADPVARATVVNDKFEEYVIVADCVRLTPDAKSINTTYLIYAINSRNVRIGAELVSTGTTRIRINLTELKKLWIPYPALKEQKVIADYLDKATTKIDTLIEKQTKLIKLLKEKRQAVISSAVTRGLDASVPMKDSGVEWLGEIPEHWYASRLKHLTRQIIDGAHFTPTYVDTGVPFLRVTDLHNESIDLDKVKFIPLNEHKELIKRCNPQKGDLLLSKNGTIGLTKIVTWGWEFSVFVSLCVIKFVNHKMLPEFFMLIFQSNSIEEQLFHSSKKTSVTNLHLDKINELYFSVPSVKEQQEIIHYLESKISRIDKLITKSTQAIDLLKEKRTALISAAVTGKIDVRDAA